MKLSTVTGTDGRVGPHVRLTAETIDEARDLMRCGVSTFIPPGSVFLDLSSGVELKIWLATPRPVEPDPNPAATRDALDRTP